jgi:hypothetical protein
VSRGAATVSRCCWDIEEVRKMNRSSWFEGSKEKYETQTTSQTTQPCCPSLLACYPDPPAMGKCYALHSHNKYFSAREQLHRRGDGAVVRQLGEREKTKKVPVAGGEDGLGRGKEQHDRHAVPCSATLSAKVCPSAVDCNGLNLSSVWNYANRRRKRGRVVSTG